MKILSTIVFTPDTTDEQQQLVRDITPHLHASRDDWVETRQVERPVGSLNDEWEATLYVIVHTGNLRGMIADLEAALII